MTNRVEWMWMGALALVAGIGVPGADAQTLGTFRWQLRPYCNVLTLTATAVDGAYRLEGTDDQCGGGGDKASAIGTAFPNPDGTIGFGLTIVATPGGVPVHVDAALAPGQFNGTWRDSAGGTGQFVLTPGAGTGGSARPLPSPGVPSTIGLRPDGSIVAGGANGAPIPASGGGTRMMWHGGKAAFRAGDVDSVEWDESNVGAGSVAFGLNTLASGRASFAAGSAAVAAGDGATAFGTSSRAAAPHSFAAGWAARAEGGSSLAVGRDVAATGGETVALGFQTVAVGPWSVAAGNTNRAEGAASVALGLGTTAASEFAVAAGSNAVASGRASLAIGEEATTNGVSAIALGYNVFADANHAVVIGANAGATVNGRGSIVLADGSTPGAAFTANAANQFRVRAAGGVTFYTNAALSAGVSVAAGGNSWSQLSDVHSKENFRELDGDAVLAKIAALPVREWNYRTQDASIRHVGPTAQDFRAAFGLGDDERRIDTIDADGVALAAVKALEARTAALRDENASLRQELAALRTLVHDALAVRR